MRFFSVDKKKKKKRKRKKYKVVGSVSKDQPSVPNPFLLGVIRF